MFQWASCRPCQVSVERWRDVFERKKGRRAMADAVNKFQTAVSCHIMTSARDFSRIVRANDA